MAQDKVDELVIELTARDKATEKIDNLAKSLRGLGESLTTGLSSAKIKSVASSLRDIGSATTELGRSTKAINNLPKLTSELSNMMNTLSQAPAISKDVLSLAHALSTIDGSAIKGFSGIATPKVNTNTAVQEMKAVESEEKKVDSQTKEVTKSVNTLGGALKNAFKGVSLVPKLNLDGLGTKMGVLSKKAWGLYKNVSLIHKLNNMSLKKGFTTLLRYTVGIRSLFVLANRIRGAIEDGNKNLAKYSAEFNKSMSLYKSGLGTMKNALSVAFAPLVNYFSEAINRILDNFIEAFNTIARLMARLTGAKQVVQATRYYNDFASSLGKAGKNAKQLTTGIDELNILNDQAGSGSGGASADVQDMFETVDVTSEFDSWIDKIKDMWDKSDFTDLGTAFADKINGALQNIDWTNIKQTSGKIGKSLATFLNGAFEEELNGQTLAYTIGQTIGEAFNTAIEFSYEFVRNFHWSSFGKAIADGIKGILETTDWSKLGSSLSSFANGLLEALESVLDDNTLWQDFGKSVGKFVSGIEWKESWFRLNSFFTTFAKALINIPEDIADGFWKEVLKAIFDPSKSKQKVQTSIDNWVDSIDIGHLMRKGVLRAISFQNLIPVESLLTFLPAPDKVAEEIKKKYNGLPEEVSFSDILGAMFTVGVEDVKDDISSMVDTSIDFLDSVFETDMRNWYDTSVKPWFTKKKWSDTAEGVRLGIVTKWEELKTNTDTKWSEIKTRLNTKWIEITESGSNKFDKFKTNVVESFEGIKKGIKAPINAIIGFVESMVNKLADGFNGLADTIKNLTSFEWTNPFNGKVYKSDGIDLPKAQKISIPRLADGGFVPNTNMGSLFWAGESGAEVVANASGGTEVLNATQVANAVTSGVRQAVVETLIPYMASLVDSNKAIADKDMSVNIGDREIAEANRRGQSQLGLQLVTI